jgi:hypothetical protein
MNTWMNNPQYLAQAGHFLGGALILTLTMLFSWNIGTCWEALAIGMIAASIKEFWFDMKYELPKQTWGDSLMDWCFYLLGGGAGIGICYLAKLHAGTT